MGIEDRESGIGNPGSRIGIRLSAFFFEFLFDRRERAGRGAQGFAVVVQRETRDVDRVGARRGFFGYDDRHGAAFDAIAEGETTAAGQARVGKPFQHLERFYYEKAGGETVNELAGLMLFRTRFQRRPA